MPINFLLVFTHATPVEPLPIALSNTVSPSFVYVLIRYSKSATGFWVGCILDCAEKSLLNFDIVFG
jgi:hypothetical protein